MISIIIVAYNNSDDIVGCLDALPWSRESLDVVVIENHSRDKTTERIREWLEKHPGKKLRPIWNKKNRGFAAGINQGLLLSTGNPILILGPDTALFPKTIRTLTGRLMKDDRIGVIAPQIVDWKGNIFPSCRRFPQIRDILLELTGLPRLFPGRYVSDWKMPDFDHRTEREVDQPEATCLLIRRAAVDSVGPMDERFPIFFNDVDWCRRFKEAGWKIFFTPAARVRHKKGTSVRQDPMRLIWKSHQGCFRYFWKYRSRGDSLAVLALGGLLIWAGVLRSVFVQTGVVKDR
jgi:N-acetylglucosaminyl-diphospho-decaprenol L-rhamnosyltransferase